MIVAVADTHAPIWYLNNDKRLSKIAKSFMDTTTQNGDQIGVASITFVEMVFITERGKIPVESLSILARTLDSYPSTFFEIPLTLPIARTLSAVNAINIPEMGDRIIAATALHLNVPIISRDSKITASNLTTIW